MHVVLIFFLLCLLLTSYVLQAYDCDYKNEEYKKEEYEKEGHKYDDIYQKNKDVIVSEEEPKHVSLETTCPRYVDYTYFNNKHKKNLYNIGIEPQSPLLTQRNLSFTMKP